MRDRALLPAAGQFYKANLDCHTVLSDGHWTKEQVKAEYQKRGYSIVAFTDHRHYGWHPELMDDTFIPIAAFEADLNGPFPPSGSFQWVKTYHLNFYDTDPAARGGFTAVQPPQRYGDLEALNGFIAQMNADGFLCCYNHPYWSLQDTNDYKDLKGVFAMEIYNHGCELDGLYGYAPQAYDEMLRAGQKLFCVSTDDNHDSFAPGDPRCDSFGGFTMFKLERLSYAGVIEALKKGDFYASTGPELHELYIRDGALHVACSPVEKIYVVTSGRRCLMQLAATTALMLGVNTMFINVMPVRIGRSSGAAVISGSLNAITYLGAAIATWGIGAAAEGFGWGAVFVLWAVMAAAALAVCLLLAGPWGRFALACEAERGERV